jgi:hypothetical protein
MKESQPILPEEIRKFTDQIEDLLSQGLTMEAVVSLIRGMPGNRLSKSTIRKVLTDLKGLNKWYIDDTQLKSKKSLINLQK